jgi:hypothetical protein
MGDVGCGVRYNTGQTKENRCRPNIDGAKGWSGIDLLFVDRPGEGTLDLADGTGAQPESAIVVVERNQQDGKTETGQRKKKDISDNAILSRVQVSCFPNHDSISNIRSSGLSTSQISFSDFLLPSLRLQHSTIVPIPA